MNEPADTPTLLEAERSSLIVIDAQPAFLDKLPDDHGRLVVENICWLIGVAHWCGIPVIATAEQYETQPVAGPVVRALAAGGPQPVAVIDKHVFGLADQAETMGAVRAAGPDRTTAVLVGLETDVCVLHSALGLLREGYRVAVVCDATGSPDPGHQLGLDRMRAAGVTIVDCKGLFYEWLRTIDEVNRFHTELPRMRAAARFRL